MIVYISGPMTGVEDGNVGAFIAASLELVEAGYASVNPVDIGRELKYKMGREPAWIEYMREDIKALLECDGIYMLDGWEKSSGARLEEHIAMRLGIVQILLEGK